MARTVSDLAKDLGLSSHDVLEVCAEEGIEADGHASVLSPDEESLIVDILLAESVKEPKKKLKKKSSGKKKKKVVKKVKKKAEPEPEEQPEDAPKTTKKVIKKVIKKVRKVVRKKPAEQPAEGDQQAEPTVAADAETTSATPTTEAPTEAEAPAAAAQARPETEPAEGEAPEEKPAAAAAEADVPAEGKTPEEGEQPDEDKKAEQPEKPEPTTPPRRRGAKIIGRAPETVLREIRAAAEEKADRGKMVERLMAKSKVTPATGTSRKRRRGRDEDEDEGASRGGKAPRKVMRKILREGGEIGGASARKGKGGKGSQQPLRRAQTKVFNPVRRSRGGAQRAPQKKVRKTEATIELPATAKDVSNAMGIRANDIIKTAMENGVMITINDPMPQDLIEMVGLEYEIEITFTTPASTEEELAEELEREDKPEELKSRSPVVTMLGHVDHGKTSLLDAIRKTDVVSGEAGGITQHIGASRVSTPSGAMVTFLDTPGHAAFTQMRARGANITDIVVLVVAADDGVMPQTEEAINHAKAAEVPVVVAVNKMDLPAANMDRVKQQMSRFELIPEDWGGSTQFVPVSAVRGDGIEDLLERIALEAELLELKANPDKPALGRVVEAEVDPQSGVEATLLVQGGTLKPGDVVLAGSAYGRVRYLMDHRGKTAEEAGPAVAVRVFGFNDAPEAGQKFWVVPDIEKARAIATQRKAAQRERAQQQRKLVSLETLFDAIQAGEREELLFIIKADVQGSVEVLSKSLTDLSTDEVRVRILHTGLGQVSESDVVLAEASEAIILGFHIMVADSIRKLARDRGVEIRLYDVIYNLIDDAKAALIGLHKPIERETVDGHAEVRDLFKISRLGTIAGCYVTDGTIERGNPVRVFRDGVQVYAGKLASLRRFKDDVRTVRDGFECGMQIEGFDDVKEGDVIESYHVEEVAQQL